MRILVCGGRNFADDILLRKTLDDVIKDHAKDYFTTHDGRKFPTGITIIHGNANGADALADQWARDNALFIVRYRALFETHGSMAGRIRNTKMLVDGKPDLVVAFPGGNGTCHMKEIARERGVPVIDVHPRRPQ